MDKEEIARLLLPYLESAPSVELLNRISAYVEIFCKWNKRINLSSIRNESEIVQLHFGESLFAARVLLDDANCSSTIVPSEIVGGDRAGSAADSPRVQDAIDVGSGAGFPGMVLKLYMPSLPVTLLESNGKKATFLREVSRTLGLTGVTVEQTRAESFGLQAELVTMRAVEKFAEILPVASSLVSCGGCLGVLVGAGQMAVAERVLPGVWHCAAVPESRARVLAIWKRQ